MRIAIRVPDAISVAYSSAGESVIVIDDAHAAGEKVLIDVADADVPMALTVEQLAAQLLRMPPKDGAR